MNSNGATMNSCCLVNIVTACDTLAAENKRLKERITEPVTVDDARIAAALDALAGVLAILARDGGFRTARQQQTIRAARALMTEMGR